MCVVLINDQVYGYNKTSWEKIGHNHFLLDILGASA